MTNSSSKHNDEKQDFCINLYSNTSSLDLFKCAVCKITIIYHNFKKKPVINASLQPNYIMQVNKAYLKGIPGIIKACILVSLIVCLICASVWCVSYRIFFLLVAIAGFLVEAAYYLAYVLNLTEKVKIHWTKFVS